MTAREFLKKLPTRLGMGCMRFPMMADAKGQTDVDIAEAIKMIRHSIDEGAVYVDTAYPYHGGVSENIVAKALKDGYREKAVLADKLPSWLVKEPADLEKYLNEQLEKLETDHIDFYLLHALSVDHWANYDKEALVDFIKKIKADGRVKYIGFSYHDELPLFKEIVDFYDWDFVQIQYNYLDIEYQAGLEGLEYLDEKGIAVVIMEPLRGGSLSGVMSEDVQMMIRKHSPESSNTRFAFDYLLADSRVDMVLSGMSTMEQLDENLATFKRNVAPHTEEDIVHYRQVRKAINDKVKVPCTACDYCMPCPHGVKIPQAFRVFNQGHMFNKVEEMGREYLKHAPLETRASKCIACGECEPKCPQHIEIIKELAEVARVFEG
ncbi:MULTISPECIES: aldo/keto reductase [unclassified Fusibacter]|uniref:aldo/keto reductase n=1 Tax=unclassified Fusibacter TaxID=2624464 RepID=UPI0010124DD9|nr:MULTISPECIES: aldo/keto reductase [unclassified Fusibacter]MCK8059589.1 aldo/keto reductase [Fusibacter sp. A2]NPE21390.1 aldo/keto reductase [Fusibacter sp. A1]RXV61806.1 aldo/keto reductase [Fusibacter sp. A1]